MNSAGYVFLFIVALFLVAALAIILGDRAANVADQLISSKRVAELDNPVFAALSAVPGIQLNLVAPGCYRVETSRRPAWTVVFAVLLFPVGLVALMYRERMILDVTLVDGPSGCTLRVAGSTRKSVAVRIGTELARAVSS